MTSEADRQNRAPEGKVYLVGAGPGARELLTLKGKRCLEEADVIIYDYLVARSLLTYASAAAERIYAGKRSGVEALSQTEIQALMVRKAGEGKVVVRLKGGDPFIFGRGGEEAEYLRDHGVSFEVVPGVTSSVAAPAYAGIPLTHRDYASSVAFITAHESWEIDSTISWDHLTRGVHTIVFLMGMRSLAENMRRLIASGCDPQRPVALIRWGTRGAQESLVGTVQNIATLARERGFKAPIITVVGEVVNLRQRLQWVETKPLFGRRIVVTRARSQASAFAEAIEDLGGEAMEFPVIEIHPPSTYDPLDAAIREIQRYQWMVFTSVNGVGYFFSRFRHIGRDIRDLAGIRIAAIGPETAKALQAMHLHVDFMPREYRAEAMLEGLPPQEVRGKRILLPRAAKAREILPQTLREWGANVDVVEAYRTLPADQHADWLRSLIKEDSVDLITFTSSSTVESFAGAFSSENDRMLLAKIPVACIGPVTQQTAAALGIRVDVVPGEFTISGLTQAIVEYFSKQGGNPGVRIQKPEF